MRVLRRSGRMARAERPKYYVYVSDTKVDMMFAQIPRKLRKRLSTELKVDLKLISVSMTDAPAEETRYSKLAVVAEYVRRELSVGTVEDPKEYFEGSMEMRWGAYERSGGEMVYFGATTYDRALGLGGSMAHVIGGATGGSPTTASSASPALYTALSQELSWSEGLQAELARSPYSTSLLHAQGEPEGGDAQIANAVVIASMNQQGPLERLEFLAKTVFQGTMGEGSVLLGTPIYVAYTE